MNESPPGLCKMCQALECTCLIERLKQWKQSAAVVFLAGQRLSLHLSTYVTATAVIESGRYQPMTDESKLQTWAVYRRGSLQSLDWNDGLEHWNRKPICSFGGQRSNEQNTIPLYMALEGPQMAPADSRCWPPDSARRCQMIPDVSRRPQMAPDRTQAVLDGPQMATEYCSPS